MSHDYLLITVGAILVNNFVLAKFLGICAFLGVSKKLGPALGMSGAVVFVVTLASAISAAIENHVITKTLSFSVMGFKIEGNLEFTRILVFIVTIAALVQMVELVSEKVTPALYESLGIYLPLITTNCLVIAIPLINADVHRGVIASTVYGFCGSLGFSLAIILFASIRERLDLAKIPKVMEGTAIALVTAGILAMGFMGFSGLVK